MTDQVSSTAVAGQAGDRVMKAVKQIARRLIHRRAIIASVFLVAAVFALAACGGDDDEAAAPTGTAPAEAEPYSGQVAISVIEASSAAPFLIAQELGYYEDAGLDLELVGFGGGAESAQGVASLGLGFSGTTAALIAFAEGSDLRLVGGGFYDPGGDFIVPADSQIQGLTADDLRGKKIGITRPGSGSEYVVTELANQLGLTLGRGKDIELVFLGDLFSIWTAAQQGLVDVAVSGAPLSTQLVVEGDARMIGTFADVVPGLPISSSWATTEFIEERPDVIQRWLDANQKAADLIENDLDAAVEAYARAAELDVEVAREALELTQDDYSTAIRREGFEEALKSAVALGHLESEDQVDLDEVIVPDFVEVE